MNDNICDVDSLVRQIITRYNKWHIDPRELALNEKVITVLKSKIKPRIFYVLERIFKRGLRKNPETWGLIILRGPRQIGKTTLVLYLAYIGATQYNLRYDSIIYMDLSEENLKKCITKGASLTDIIEKIISGRQKPVLLIIDEASLYPDWSLAIKNLVDRGVLKRGIITLVTGSHAIELAMERNYLIGRYGPLCEDSEIRTGPRQYYYPLRFAEFVESLNKELDDMFRDLKIRHSKTKYAIIRHLLEPDRNPEDIRVFNFVLSSYADIIEVLFRYYLLVSGYPSLVAYLKENFGDVVNNGMPSSLYEVIYSGLKSDLDKFRRYRLRVEVFMEILREISNRHYDPTASLEVSYDALINKLRVHGLGKGLPYSAREYRDVLRAHLDYLREIKAILEIHPLKVISKELVPESGKPLSKIIFTDPSIALAFYSFLNHIPNPYKFCVKALEEHRLPNLVEAVALSHLAMLPQLLSPSPENIASEPIGYLVSHRVRSEEDKTVYERKGEIDGITWFYSYLDNKRIYVPLEVKYKHGELEDNDIDVYRSIKSLIGNQRLLVTVAFELKEIYSDVIKGVSYVVLPLPLFLILI